MRRESERPASRLGAHRERMRGTPSGSRKGKEKKGEAYNFISSSADARNARCILSFMIASDRFISFANFPKAPERGLPSFGLAPESSGLLIVL